MKQSCPKCKNPVDPHALKCSSCGTWYTKGQDPVVADAAPSRLELEDAYKQWLTRGQNALSAGDYDEAINCLREAVKKSRILDDAEAGEINARKFLGEAFEKQNRIPEAADQYRIISQLTSESILREVWLKKSEDLLASTNHSFDSLFRREDFRPLLEEEVRYVPLYCCGCKRLLAEAEVFPFRRGLSDTVRCWCGIVDRPLAKADATHAHFLEEARAGRGQRSRAIEAANKELVEGKKRSTACLLAVFLGWAGVHKFYLGDRVLGYIYITWCWTLVPLLLSLYEAVVLWNMSLVSFNMTYNLDLVLKEILPEDSEKEAKLDVFSLELNESGSQQRLF